MVFLKVELNLLGGLEARDGHVDDPQHDKEDGGGDARAGRPAELAAEEDAAPRQATDAGVTAQTAKTITERPRSPPGTTKAALLGLSSIHFCTSAYAGLIFKLGTEYLACHLTTSASDTTDQ